MKFVLSVYGRDLSNVCAIVSDNCSTNLAIAKSLSIGFIGCASHRYKLAIKDLLDEHKYIPNKAHTVMCKFRYPVPAGKLRKLTHLKPKLNVVTRWSSSIDMFKRYVQLRDVFRDVDIEGIDELLLTAKENKTLDRVILQFAELESITKALQRHDVSIADVRA